MINDIINLNNNANTVIVAKTYSQKLLLLKQKSKQEKLKNKVFNLKIMTQDDLIEKLSFSIDHVSITL